MWAPDVAAIKATLMAEFAQSLGLEPLPYERLHRYSLSHMSEFWEAFWNFSGMIGSGAGPALQLDDASVMTSARFFLIDSSTLPRTCWRAIRTDLRLSRPAKPA